MELYEISNLFLSNKYTKYYISIIQKAISENRTKNSNIYECHHILPKSIYKNYKKDKWNLVFLTFREHYICHLLLPKMFNNKNAIIKMQNALIRFTKNKKYSKNIHLAKIAFIKRNKNRIVSNETRIKLRKANSGINNPFFGKKHNIESIEKIKQANKLSKALRSQKMLGKNNPMYGKFGTMHPLFNVPCSEERKKKISIANKGKLKDDKNPSKREDVKIKIKEQWKQRVSNKLFITPYGNFYFLRRAHSEYFNKNNVSLYKFSKYFNNKEGFLLKYL